MATLLPGFRRLPGTARKYQAPTGELISYRAYRDLVERGGAVRRLGPVELANRRRKQAAFNDIVRQMAKVRGDMLDQAAEAASRAGETERAAALKRERARVKSHAIRSPSRKEAMAELELYHHAATPKGRRRAARAGVTPAEAAEREKAALIVLGRRQGIPDWVPVGASDRFRKGQLRRRR